jgi:hypothetical protein
MVISPPVKGVILVILGDGELLPENLNREKVVVMRRGESTNRELKVVKKLGELATPDLLKPPVEPICTYTPVDGNPLHEHRDGKWWFYDETWALENGPYESFEDGSVALEAYCTTVLAVRTAQNEIETNDLTSELENDRMTDDGNIGLQKDIEEASDAGGRGPN